MAKVVDAGTTYALVQDCYGAYAREQDNKTYSQAVATAFGYSPKDLESIPEGANLGLSCGNPIALAGLVPGETVIDLGCGAGLDVFLAAEKVAPDGKAIGVDMNKDMLTLANRNALKSRHSQNVTFIESAITSIPALLDATAHCITSNCVINLVPHAHKHLVFEEIWRLLKPGGRVALSDILAKKELSDNIRGNEGLYVGCVAGASQVDEYEGWLRGAGFLDIVIIDTQSDVNIYKTAGSGIQDEKYHKTTPSTATTGTSCGSSTKPIGCCQPLRSSKCCTTTSSAATVVNGDKEGEQKEEDPEDLDLNEWVGSFRIYAIKPN